MHSAVIDVEVAVVGGGPAGMIAAELMAAAGIDTVLVGPPPAADWRTTALMASSLEVLERLDLWPALAPKTGRLRAMRIIDGTRRLFRAPEVTFRSAELGLDAFGHNIRNDDLNAALLARAGTLTHLVRVEALARAIEPAEDRVRIETSGGGTVSARLVIGADGRNSPCREAAGIAHKEWAYPQAALVLNVEHTRPHNDISTEFHTETGPYTLVPLPGMMSSIVMVLRPQEAERLAALPAEELAGILERRCGRLLGTMKVVTPASIRPLGAMTVARYGARRIALVGEAAHVIPPIGAQGLNLGVRDGEALAEIVSDARAKGRDPGGPDILDRYHRARRGDVKPRIMAVDMLNRSLLSDLVPAQLARGGGLWLLDHVAPLRRMVMREGLAPRLRAS